MKDHLHSAYPVLVSHGDPDLWIGRDSVQSELSFPVHPFHATLNYHPLSLS